MCLHVLILMYMHFCSRLEEINENELTKEDSAKLEEIFNLLVDCTKSRTTLVNSCPLQSPAPIQPSDRSVTQNVLIKSPMRLLSLTLCPLPKPSTTINPHMDFRRAVHSSDYYTVSVVNCINYVLSGICRVAFLLELALLALQVKHQKIAVDCLKELKSSGEAVSVRYSLKTSGNRGSSCNYIIETCKFIHGI